MGFEIQRPRFSTALVQYLGGAGQAAAAVGGALSRIGGAKLALEQQDKQNAVREGYLNLQKDMGDITKQRAVNEEADRQRKVDANLATNIAIRQASGQPVPREMSQEYGQLALQDPSTNLAILTLGAKGEAEVADRESKRQIADDRNKTTLEAAMIRANGPRQLFDYKREVAADDALGALKQVGYDTEVNTAQAKKMQQQAELEGTIPNLQSVNINGVVKYYTSSKLPYVTAPEPKAEPAFSLWPF